MIDIFLQTIPFFALIAVGFGAAKVGFFSAEATAYLTKFVFYFALTAMILKFSANLSLGEVLDFNFILAYLAASIVVYIFATCVAMARGVGWAEAAVEAQCSVIGNVGFLGIPMLALLLGEAAIGPVIMLVSVDLMVFSSLIVIVITFSRQGHLSMAIFKSVGIGILKNPMVVSIAAGFAYAATGWPIPVPVNSFLTLLGAAATPCALFAIGASLAEKSAERISVAGWLTFCKLVLHPAAVAVSALWIFDVEVFSAHVMIACAALPVAGNVYILAQHYGVAPQRVSASILISTLISVVTLSMVIAWVTGV
ncbi:MAG: AEC family transporter [Paracoccaceae bacterium]|nr:AEC family transporter [Paracoccaceae bacterium]